MTFRSLPEFGTAREQWETSRNDVDIKKTSQKHMEIQRESKVHFQKNVLKWKIPKKTRKYLEKY